MSLLREDWKCGCFALSGSVVFFGGMVDPMNESASAYLLFFVGVDN